MRPRLKQFLHALNEKKLDACLVTHSADIDYLLGYSASDAWLLVTSAKAYYVTDSRYGEQARQGLGRSAAVRICKTSLEAEAARIAVSHGIKRLGFDTRYLSVARFKRVKAACGKFIRFIAADGIVGELRAVKDAGEIARIRRCLEVTHEAYAYVRRRLRPGLTEREILWMLEGFIRTRKAGFAFDPIIASGPNSAFPHARVSDRVIKHKDIILIDLGMKMNGYNSDLTRIFLSDKITRSFRDVYQAVAEAQEAAIARIRSGAAVVEADLAARKSLKRKKLEKFFTHALGHGVGVEIHEAPRLSVKSADILKAGMVVTIEPGVYLPGDFGIRIEDMVLVTEQGCEILSRGAQPAEPFYF